jgi:hypothetical protein
MPDLGGLTPAQCRELRSEFVRMNWEQVCAYKRERERPASKGKAISMLYAESRIALMNHVIAAMDDIREKQAKKNKARRQKMQEQP